jgi:hypothetical protein
MSNTTSQGPPDYHKVVEASQPVVVFEKDTEASVPSSPTAMKKRQGPTPIEKYQQLTETDMQENTIPYTFLGRWPARVRCEVCGETGLTKVEYKISGSTQQVKEIPYGSELTIKVLRQFSFSSGQSLVLHSCIPPRTSRTANIDAVVVVFTW